MKPSGSDVRRANRLSKMAMATLLQAGVALVAQAGHTDAQEQSKKSAAPQPAVTAIREIHDPHTGIDWLLLRDAVCAGGPGRLVRVGAGIDTSASNVESRRNVRRVSAVEVPPRLVILAGDPLIVEENTATIEARLEAIALGAAAPGSLFQARLKIGGRIVPVIARTEGHAVLAPEAEVVR